MNPTCDNLNRLNRSFKVKNNSISTRLFKRWLYQTSFSSLLRFDHVHVHDHVLSHAHGHLQIGTIISLSDIVSMKNT